MPRNGQGECWCILRTSGRNTLRLAETLSADGFEVWTPVETLRHPRTRARSMAPSMPTYVFAKADRLTELLERSEAPAPPIAFSLFRHWDKIPVIADAELNALRRYEAKAAPREAWPSFAPNEGVTAAEGPYSGLGGKVIRSRGEWALVLFGWQRVKISTFILKPIVANTVQAQQGIAA